MTELLDDCEQFQKEKPKKVTVYKENCPNVRLQYKWQILRERGLPFLR